jgi:HSP20 family molecular chaperone IbpA
VIAGDHAAGGNKRARSCVTESELDTRRLNDERRVMMLFDTFKELDRISSTFFSGFPEPALSAAPVNLYRNDDRYVMEVDLPAFDDPRGS